LGAKITYFSEPSANEGGKKIYWLKKHTKNKKNNVPFCQFFVFLPFRKSSI